MKPSSDRQGFIPYSVKKPSFWKRYGLHMLWWMMILLGVGVMVGLGFVAPALPLVAGFGLGVLNTSTVSAAVVTGVMGLVYGLSFYRPSKSASRFSKGVISVLKARRMSLSLVPVVWLVLLATVPPVGGALGLLCITVVGLPLLSKLFELMVWEPVLKARRLRAARTELVQRLGVVTEETSSGQTSVSAVPVSHGAILPVQEPRNDWTDEILGWDWRGRMVFVEGQLQKDYRRHFNRTWYRFLFVWSWHLERYFTRIREEVAAHDRVSEPSGWWHGFLGWWHDIDDKRRLIVLKDLKDQLTDWSVSDADPDAGAIERAIATSLQLKGRKVRGLTWFLLRLSGWVYVKGVSEMDQVEAADRHGDLTLEEMRAKQFVEEVFSEEGARPSTVMQVDEMMSGYKESIRVVLVNIALTAHYAVVERLLRIISGMKTEFLNHDFKEGAVQRLNLMLNRYNDIRPDHEEIHAYDVKALEKHHDLMLGKRCPRGGSAAVYAELIKAYKQCWDRLSAERVGVLMQCEDMIVSELSGLMDDQFGLALRMIDDRHKAQEALGRGSMYYRVWGVESDSRYKARYDREVMGAIKEVLTLLGEHRAPESYGLCAAMKRFRERAVLLENPDDLFALSAALDGKDSPKIDGWVGAHQASLQACVRDDLAGVTQLYMREWQERKESRKVLEDAEYDKEQLELRCQGERDIAMRDSLAYGTERESAVAASIKKDLDLKFGPLFKKLNDKIEKAKSNLEIKDKLPSRMKALESCWEVFKVAREAWEKLDKSLEINITCELSHVDDTTIVDFNDWGGKVECEPWLYNVRPLNHYAIYYYDREELYVEETDGKWRYLGSEASEQAARRAKRQIKTERKRTWHVLGRDDRGQVHRFAMDLDNLLPPWEGHAVLLKQLSELSPSYWEDPVVLQVMCYPLLETISDLVGTPLFTSKMQRVGRVVEATIEDGVVEASGDGKEKDGEIDESGYVDVSIASEEEDHGNYQWLYRQHYRGYYLPALKLLGRCERLVKMRRMLITGLYDEKELMPSEAWALLVRTSWGGEIPLASLRDLDPCVNDDRIFHKDMKDDEEIYARMTSAETHFNLTYEAFRHRLLSVIRENEQESIDDWCASIISDNDLQLEATKLKKAYQDLMRRRGMDGRFDRHFAALPDEIKQVFEVQLDRISEMCLKRYNRVRDVLSDVEILRRYLFTNYITCPHKGLKYGLMQSDDDAGHKWGMLHEYREDVSVYGFRRILLRMEEIRADTRRIRQESEELFRRRTAEADRRTEEIKRVGKERERQYAIDRIRVVLGNVASGVKNAEEIVNRSSQAINAIKLAVSHIDQTKVDYNGSHLDEAKQLLATAQEQAKQEAGRAEEIKANAHVLLAALGAQLEGGDGRVEVDADTGAAAATAGASPIAPTEEQVAAARKRFTELVGRDVVGDVDLMGAYVGGEDVFPANGAVGALLNGRRVQDSADTNGSINGLRNGHVNGHANGHHHYEDDPEDSADAAADTPEFTVNGNGYANGQHHYEEDPADAAAAPAPDAPEFHANTFFAKRPGLGGDAGRLDASGPRYE